MTCFTASGKCKSPVHCREQGRCSGFTIKELHPANRFGLMFGQPMIEPKPETNMSTPTHKEAREILGRFNNSHFNNPGEHARYSIPARPDRDDDLRFSAYIDHCQSVETELAAALERERALRQLLQGLDNELSIQPPPRPGEYHWPRAHKIVKQVLALCTEGNPNTPAAYP